MTDNLLKSLREMYCSSFNEQKEIQEKLGNNLNKLSEITSYLDSLEKEEENDFKIFSPRSVSVLYKEDIQNKNVEKKQIELENVGLYRSEARLDSQIKTLSGVLSIFNIQEENLDGNSLLETALNKEDIIERLNILDIQEKERQRIARDLHDVSLQNLTHIVHKIELSSLYLEKDPMKAKLELALINKNLKSVIQEIRDTIFDLRPMTFDDLGLKESFDRLVDKLKEASGLNIQSEIEEINCYNPLILMTIFRIVEECMNNAVKHSGGNIIKFVLKKTEEGKCFINISDNGKGFQEEDTPSISDKHFGLQILEERVKLLSGTLFIDSKPETGTSIKVWIPIFD